MGGWEKTCFHTRCTICNLTDVFKGCLWFFPDFGFFWKKNQKCSRMTSSRHITMRVGAFESSDNKETFLFLFHGHRWYRKFSRDTQTWQLLCFSWLIPDTSREKKHFIQGSLNKLRKTQKLPSLRVSRKFSVCFMTME